MHWVLLPTIAAAAVLITTSCTQTEEPTPTTEPAPAPVTTAAATAPTEPTSPTTPTTVVAAERQFLEGQMVQSDFELQAWLARRNATAFRDYGVVANVEACRLVSPGLWEVDGTIAVPVGIDRTKVGLAFVGQSAGVTQTLEGATVDVTGTGPFTLTVRRGPLGRSLGVPSSAPPPPLHPDQDRLEACGLEVVWSDAPIAPSEEVLVEALIESSEVGYEAPANSIQALGVGAQLDAAADPRLVWAYLGARATPLPFRTIWVPGPDSGFTVTAVRGEYTDSCVIVELAVVSAGGGEGSILHKLDCPFTDPDPVEGGRTFGDFSVVTNDDGGPEAVLQTEEYLLHVTMTPAGGLEDLLSSLEPLENVDHFEPTYRTAVDADLDTAVAGSLPVIAQQLQSDLLVEVARVEMSESWLVLASTRNNAGPFVSEIEFRTAQTGWVGAPVGGAGWDGCLFVNGTGFEGGSYFVAYAGPPAAGLELLADPGAGFLAQVGRALVVLYPGSEAGFDLVSADTVRAVDEEGNDANCVPIGTAQKRPVRVVPPGGGSGYSR